MLHLLNFCVLFYSVRKRLSDHTATKHPKMIHFPENFAKSGHPRLREKCSQNRPKRFKTLQADGCRPLRIRLSDQTDPTLQGRSRLHDKLLSYTLQGRSRLRPCRVVHGFELLSLTLQGRSGRRPCRVVRGFRPVRITFYSRLIISNNSEKSN